MRRAADLGAWIELCGPNLAPGRMKPEEAVAWCRDAGLERVVISSDYFRPEAAGPPEYLGELLDRLYRAGLTVEEIRRAVSENPARALGIG